MRIKDRIKYILDKIKARKIETVIITEKQCPHCASRGLFVFNDTPIFSNTKNEAELKDTCQSESVND